MEAKPLASIPTTTTDLQMVMQALQKMQMDADHGFQDLKKEFKEEVTHRVEQVSLKVEHLASRIEQCENHRTQEIKNIQDQIDAMKSIDSTIPLVTHQSSTTGKVHKAIPQSQNLLRMALDKQIDELKPYYGKKQESVESWIKRLDKLAEISRMSDEEVFLLAQLKLQGDAEKWWDNKKREIDSWVSLKSKLMDTFGSLGKSNRLELEALLHRRRQNLNEPATKYWNDMMSHCSAYDENMSTQDRVWRICNGALPEFRHKYENKIFDDVDQLLKVLIQHEEHRLRPSSEEQDYHGPNSSLARESQSTTWNHRQFSEAVNQVAGNQPRSSWNNKPTALQQPISRPDTSNNRQNSSHPN